MLILLFIIVSILPLTMIGFGRLWVTKGAGKVNNILGYKTIKSTKNQETWDFAHHYIGNLWSKIGLIIYVASIVSLFLYDNITIIMYVQLVVFIAPIIPTEIKLSRSFNEEGIPFND